MPNSTIFSIFPANNKNIFSSVSIVDFEQVNVCGVMLLNWS